MTWSDGDTADGVTDPNNFWTGAYLSWGMTQALQLY
jgi:hypothetical protein